MQAAEAIVKILESEGITDAFGIPGAGINAVYKYLKDAKITHYTMRHEEAAVHAADAYFRASGKMAAAICTSGPGATNFITGLYTAQIDSIPLIALTGQAVSAQLGKEAFQCVDIATIAKPVSKATWCVTNAADIPRVMREAFKTAREGRPGPVVIDLPLDVQMAEIPYDPAADKPLSITKPSPEAGKISSALDMVLAAKNPLIIMGGGVVLAEATRECVELAEYLQIPVITTYMAKGGIPIDHPLNAGHAGIQVGQPLGNHYFLGSDVVLGIGCRFTDRHTGGIAVYRGERKFIHIDIEPSQIGKIFQPDIGIVADAKAAITALLAEAKKRGSARQPSERAAALPAKRKELARKTSFDNQPIKPPRVYQEINAFYDENTLFTTGCGLNQIWSGQFQEINKPRRYLPSGGAGTLGFDIPAAIGASIAAGKKRAVAVMGDFGFTFLVEELAVARKYDVPVTVLILNNATMSLIRQNQKYAYSYEYAVEMKENKDFIDYLKVAEGFGCLALRVTKADDIQAALKKANEHKGPSVVEILVEDNADCSMGPTLDAVKEF
ncbi:MAG: thiamine pyrophosphate-binding protein [Spirochaetaceae bacterium]|nr:thiamine pyrophosphate-binding protein [Spirochaetaceae bacterium]